MTLTAAWTSRAAPDDVSNFVLVAAWTAFLVIAASLCFMRPSRMTWAFFCYAFVACCTTVVFVPTSLPFAWYAAYIIFASTQNVAGLFLVLFAAPLPRGRRRWLEAPRRNHDVGGDHCRPRRSSLRRNSSRRMRSFSPETHCSAPFKLRAPSRLV
jgi:energy-coupling factor transporter transmembrane protein EcfT